MDVLNNLEQGREAYGRRAWGEAHRSLTLADEAASLGAEDLERLAVSAYLIGRDEDFLRAMERAHHAYVEAGTCERAARCAFWLGLGLLLGGETGHATGWLARGRRILEREGRECVEQGYLLLPVAEQHLGAGEHEAAGVLASDSAAIGDRFGDADLVACARHVQGRALMQGGQVETGLALLDEAMLAVSAGELSPLMTGLVYCSVIEACQQVYALDRAREWTYALARWCEEQPEIVAFTGTCLVHRAEVMQVHGEWRGAFEEARRACERFSRGLEPQPPAAALYQQAEVHRLRGEFAASEDAYRGASQSGLDPQPGLALLRLAQGQTETAAAALRRVLGATTDRLERTRLLPATVEVLLAAGDIEGARRACDELEEIARGCHTEALGAMAAQSRGAVDLATGNPQGALVSLRHAWQTWRRIEAPYLAARVRVLLGLAYRALGDDEGKKLELDAARAAFEQLGAAPDVARIDALTLATPSDQSAELTPRELQVLRMVATGQTNRAIAAELFLSEKTVDRHVSNILAKLDVPSRAAATAYAYEHHLL